MKMHVKKNIIKKLKTFKIDKSVQRWVMPLKILPIRIHIQFKNSNRMDIPIRIHPIFFTNSIRESFVNQFSIQFNSKNTIIYVKNYLQPQIKIRQKNLVPWITVQTKNKKCGYSQYLIYIIWGILVHKLRIIYVQLYIL